MRRIFWIVLLALTLCPLMAKAQEPKISTSDPLAQALQQSDFYLEKAAKSKAGPDDLMRLTDSHKGTSRPLKIAIVNQLPSTGKPFGTQEAYTEGLQKFLGLKDGSLIIVSSTGVSAFTEGLPPEKTAAILQKTGPQIMRDPVSGLRKTVQAIDGQMGSAMKTPVAAGAMAAGGGSPAGGGGAPAPESSGAANLMWLLPVAGVALLLALVIAVVQSKRRAIR